MSAFENIAKQVTYNRVGAAGLSPTRTKMAAFLRSCGVEPGHMSFYADTMESDNVHLVTLVDVGAMEPLLLRTYPDDDGFGHYEGFEVRTIEHLYECALDQRGEADGNVPG